MCHGAPRKSDLPCESDAACAGHSVRSPAVTVLVLLAISRDPLLSLACSPLASTPPLTSAAAPSILGYWEVRRQRLVEMIKWPRWPAPGQPS